GAEPPRVKLIARHGVGYDSVDVAALSARGVLLTNTPDAVRRPVATMALTLVLALAQKLLIKDGLTRSGRWGQRVEHMGQGLTGKTLGILGLGAIGGEVARLATALGMRVIGTKRRPAPAPNVTEILPPERSNEVIAQSDFLLLLLPSTPATDNFINAERLALMKPTAWLLNFGRGHAIVDADLIAATKRKKIAGALLDVYRQEPLPADHPFWKAEGIVVLPHVGGPHPQRDRFVAKLFVENLGRFVRGEPLKEVVDRAAGY
ncbi:MAG: hypothetical protein NTV97_08290, partial [Alphaproteobacteria bacterium]|nr:hypothetical protein [Alphaproteobacteria bacterium]